MALTAKQLHERSIAGHASAEARRRAETSAERTPPAAMAAMKEAFGGIVDPRRAALLDMMDRAASRLEARHRAETAPSVKQGSTSAPSRGAVALFRQGQARADTRARRGPWDTRSTEAEVGRRNATVTFHFPRAYRSQTPYPAIRGRALLVQGLARSPAGEPQNLVVTNPKTVVEAQRHPEMRAIIASTVGVVREHQAGTIERGHDRRLIPENTPPGLVAQAYKHAAWLAIHKAGLVDYDFGPWDEAAKAEFRPLVPFMRYASRRVFDQLNVQNKGKWTPFRDEFGEEYRQKKFGRETGVVRNRMRPNHEFIKLEIMDGELEKHAHNLIAIHHAARTAITRAEAAQRSGGRGVKHVDELRPAPQFDGKHHLSRAIRMVRQHYGSPIAGARKLQKAYDAAKHRRNSKGQWSTGGAAAIGGAAAAGLHAAPRYAEDVHNYVTGRPTKGAPTTDGERRAALDRWRSGVDHLRVAAHYGEGNAKARFLGGALGGQAPMRDIHAAIEQRAGIGEPQPKAANRGAGADIVRAVFARHFGTPSDEQTVARAPEKLWRGMHGAAAKPFHNVKPGDVIDTGAPQSWTRDPSVAGHFARFSYTSGKAKPKDVHPSQFADALFGPKDRRAGSRLTAQVGGANVGKDVPKVRVMLRGLHGHQMADVERGASMAGLQAEVALGAGLKYRVDKVRTSKSGQHKVVFASVVGQDAEAAMRRGVVRRLLSPALHAGRLAAVAPTGIIGAVIAHRLATAHNLYNKQHSKRRVRKGLGALELPIDAASRLEKVDLGFLVGRDPDFGNDNTNPQFQLRRAMHPRMRRHAMRLRLNAQRDLRRVLNGGVTRQERWQLGASTRIKDPLGKGIIADALAYGARMAAPAIAGAGEAAGRAYSKVGSGIAAGDAAIDRGLDATGNAISAGWKKLTGGMGQGPRMQAFLNHPQVAPLKAQWQAGHGFFYAPWQSVASTAGRAVGGALAGGNMTGRAADIGAKWGNRLGLGGEFYPDVKAYGEPLAGAAAGGAAWAARGIKAGLGLGGAAYAGSKISGAASPQPPQPAQPNGATAVAQPAAPAVPGLRKPRIPGQQQAALGKGLASGAKLALAAAGGAGAAIGVPAGAQYLADHPAARAAAGAAAAGTTAAILSRGRARGAVRQASRQIYESSMKNQLREHIRHLGGAAPSPHMKAQFGAVRRAMQRQSLEQARAARKAGYAGIHLSRKVVGGAALAGGGLGYAARPAHEYPEG